MGTGIFSIPDESWPQINEERETQLRSELEKLSKNDLPKINTGLNKLYDQHKERNKWVWTELGYSPSLQR